MPWFRVQPPSYPTNLLPNVDWERRVYKGFVTAAVQHKIHDMEVQDDDVWVISLPKCGNTWTAELVWLIMNDYAFDVAKSEEQDRRAPVLELDFMIYGNEETCLKNVENLKSPRLIKTHLPLPLLPSQLWTKKPKVIYVARNPKDYFVSAYYHARSVGTTNEPSLNEFVLQTLKTKQYDEFAFNHVTDFYGLRNEPWVYYTSYEKMRSQLPEVIKDVCQHLGKTITEEQIRNMLNHLSFDQMKVNPTTNHIEAFQLGRKAVNKPYEHHNFVRRGKVGGYKDELSEECISKLDDWIEREISPHNVTMDELLLLPL